MSRQKPAFAILFSAILAFGVTLSAIHLHPADNHENLTLHQVTDADHLCLMCGSVVKHAPVQEYDLTDQSVPVFSLFVFASEFVAASNLHDQSDRAPPFFPAA